MGVFVRRVELPVPASDAFAWHERSGAFERLSPPWQKVRVIERAGGIQDGARVMLDLGFPAGRWSLEHHGYVTGREFRDRQLSGPFARYQHTHRFEPQGEQCVLEDRIEYELPLAPLSRVAEPMIDAQFDALFAWRHRVTRLDLSSFAARSGPALTIGLTGASGMIGRELTAFLETQGCLVRPFVRRAARAQHEIVWDPAAGVLDPAALSGLDAVVHLSGAGVADAPWTEARKRELVASRVDSTALLARTLAAASPRPRVLVSTSAIGWYGDRGDEPLDERSAPGEGFLAELASQWESAALPAAEAGVRVVHPRIGLVLWPQGGALPKLVLPTRFGAGGPLGNGRQWWSWITLHDLLAVILRAIDDDKLSGPVNAIAPEPIRQRDFATVLGRVLSRPAFVPAPAFALHAILGREMASQMLLAGQRLTPRVLQGDGYRFRDAHLEPALAGLLGQMHGEAV